MNKKLAVSVPLNRLSFGNVSYNLLREMHKKGMDISLFPMGDIDLSAFDKTTPEFSDWLQHCINERFTGLTADTPTLKLWHLNGSENRITEKQFLFTFHELTQATPMEVTLANLQTKTIFSSESSKDIFTNSGCSNASSVKLGFDEDFKTLDKQYYDQEIVFGLSGKFEKRKHTAKIIDLWVKKYGNNPKYRLHCLVNNPHIDAENMRQIITSLCDETVYNVAFYNPLATNTLMNDWINSIDIDLSGLSGAEGWNLGAFNSTCLGKRSIVLNHTAHKDWANKDNCILIEPNGTESSADGVFFAEGAAINQGDIFTFDSDEAVAAMEKAASMAKIPNLVGAAMGENMTYDKTLDSILQEIYGASLYLR